MRTSCDNQSQYTSSPATAAVGALDGAGLFEILEGLYFFILSILNSLLGFSKYEATVAVITATNLPSTSSFSKRSLIFSRAVRLSFLC